MGLPVLVRRHFYIEPDPKVYAVQTYLQQFTSFLDKQSFYQRSYFKACPMIPFTARSSPISNSIHYKVWDEIVYPFPNFNGNNWILWMDKQFHRKLYSASDYLSMLGFKLKTMLAKWAPVVTLCHNSTLNAFLFTQTILLRISDFYWCRPSFLNSICCVYILWYIV